MQHVHALVLKIVCSLFSARMFHQLCWFDFWGSIALNGQTSMLMLILLPHWKLAHLLTQGWGQRGLLEAKSSCRLVTQLNMRRYVRNYSGFSYYSTQHGLSCHSEKCEAIYSLSSGIRHPRILHFLVICVYLFYVFPIFVIEGLFPYAPDAWSNTTWRPFSCSRRCFCVEGHSSSPGLFFSILLDDAQQNEFDASSERLNIGHFQYIYTSELPMV